MPSINTNRLNSIARSLFATQGRVPTESWQTHQPGQYDDSDLRRARQLSAAQMTYRQGTNFASGYEPEIAALRARSAQRQGLQQSLPELPELEAQELGMLGREADAALSQGLRSTRQNYNRRGLLYSGLREAGEQQKRGEVASGLASAQSEARRDYANLGDSRRQAMASLGLQSQAQALQAANLAMENAMRNAIARRQSFQQMAGGFGAGMGSFMGSGSTPPGGSSTGGYSSNMGPQRMY